MKNVSIQIIEPLKDLNSQIPFEKQEVVRLFALPFQETLATKIIALLLEPPFRFDLLINGNDSFSTFNTQLL